MPDTLTQMYFLDPLQLDAIKEAANIGAGHAATELASIAKQEVMVDTPRVSVARLQQALGPMLEGGQEVAGALINVMGDITGKIVFLVPRSTMVHDPKPSEDRQAKLDLMQEMFFGEAANRLTTAYVEAIANLLGMVVVPSPAGMAVAPAGRVLEDFGLDLTGKKYVFCISNQFKFTDQGSAFQGHFMFLPDQEALPAIVRALFGGK
jgi:chemotaxis protein CheC